MAAKPRTLQIQQANCFYNYTIGLDFTQVDLLKTASGLLKSGIARTVCFSDMSAVYIDEHGKIQLELIDIQGRRWDKNWTIKFSESLPKHTAEDLTFCLELSFHEQRIEGDEVRQVPPYLRAALPPIVLESNDLTLPIYPWLKLHADGLMSICFQLDTEWNNLDEDEFINDIVNLFQRYFKCVWVQATLQRIDGEQLLQEAFEGKMSIGGQDIINRKSRKLIKNMRRTAKKTLDDSLNKEGRFFNLHDESWLLHQIAGSEDQVEWEGTIDLCRSIYSTAIASQIVSTDHKENRRRTKVELWQGRPSISLIRFTDQPQSKSQLLNKYSQSMSRVLLRSAGMNNPPPLPPDLRIFDDYCFHGNRAILLWTWLRQHHSSDNAWNDPNTKTHLFENQARAEHFEYHNMCIARACAMAGEPQSDENLMYAYETLAKANTMIHQSSKAGEITDALEFLMNSAGTMGLIASGKEQARWHLDERRYKAEKRRSRADRWLTAVFGIVGAAGLADLVVQPFLKATYPDWVGWFTGLSAFAFASLAIILFVMLISVVNTIRKE